MAGPGWARHGAARHGDLGRSKKAHQFPYHKAGKARLGMAWLGRARHGDLGMSKKAYHFPYQQGRLGVARQGVARPGMGTWAGL